MKMMGYSAFLISDSGSVFIEESKHEGITFTFPSDPVFAKYKDRLMAVVEVKMESSKFSLTKSKIDLSSVKLQGVKVVDDKFYEDSISLWAFESRTLGKTMRVVSDGEASKIPAKRETDYVVPIIVNTIEFSSKEEHVGRFVFPLPDEWFVLSGVHFGQDGVKIRKENSKIDLDSFSTEIIVGELKQHRVFNDNLWDLYQLYKSLESFETKNESLPEPLGEEMPVSDLDLEDSIPESADLYLAGDRKTTNSLHREVVIQSSIEKIGTFSKKKGVVLRVKNNSDLGTVKAVHISFRLLDPMGKELYVAEKELDGLSVGPGEAKKQDFTDFPEFTDQQLERVAVNLISISWSNGLKTLTSSE
ncbi:MAG: hypothetical protein PHD38_01295 [Mesotoga sp.]|uniref:hypothetical protein n=1 Tax=Mesotoga sp. TaxID=2053577 RepID=UPI00260C1378|nr:hypothetical protein [Mesotoga sp.]MDI9367188.1 hypothetical protein [Thermotogota bacterium]MDD2333020.1 hypothetical protein [Mesotoga sp.]MDD3679891.1 hypothetical protein [Mesotoga sp.]MDD4206944.1 hypothetical protein [Mesotoga sp.]MDD4825055.1 hypothetical protein [Mesotoga sp.]